MRSRGTGNSFVGKTRVKGRVAAVGFTTFLTFSGELTISICVDIVVQRYVRGGRRCGMWFSVIAGYDNICRGVKEGDNPTCTMNEKCVPQTIKKVRQDCKGSHCLGSLGSTCPSNFSYLDSPWLEMKVPPATLS